MLINYFKCKFGNDADERNFGTDDDPYYRWVYYCSHPDGNKRCNLDNKYCGDEDDCKLLDKE